MIRAIAFDLDNTLADLGKAVSEDIVKELQDYERNDILILICSGKPIYYLCGLVRQLSLVHPILIGENGAAIQVGLALPPTEKYFLQTSEDSRKLLALMREELIVQFADSVWLQPNEVSLTFFFKDAVTKTKLKAYFDKQFKKKNVSNLLNRFEHIDSFDICPAGIDKGKALSYIAGLKDIDLKDIIAVGDEKNDYPMLEAAGFSIGINLKDPKKATFMVKNINEAIRCINHIMEEKR